MGKMQQEMNHKKMGNMQQEMNRSCVLLCLLFFYKDFCQTIIDKIISNLKAEYIYLICRCNMRHPIH